MRTFSLALILALISTTILSLFPVAASAAAWEQGASIVPSSTTDYGSSSFEQSLKNLKNDGANFVNLIIPYYQSNTGSTDIGAGYNTPADQALESAIQYAHSIGLKVEISIYLNSYDGQWRAYINPSDRNTWYTNYGNVLTHYAQIAQQYDVEQYCLGAELISMTSAAVNPDNTERWETMIANVKKLYSGALIYSANRDMQDSFHDEADNIQFWNELDYIGVSAYYSLNGDGSVSSLESQWQAPDSQDITPLSQQWGKPVIFTEVGYVSVTGAHSQPWNATPGGSYDPQEQANDYTALLQYWNNRPQMDGVFWWWWSTNPNYGGNGNTDYTPQNKPAEQVLQQLWGGAGESSGSPSAPATSIDSSASTTSNDPPATATSSSATSTVMNVVAPSIASSSTSVITSSTTTTDIWWPVNDVHINAVQPFKAMLTNLDPSQYVLYWQVDGGTLNLMSNSTAVYPHKESDVNIASWNWRGDGPYTVGFVAKNKNGNVLASTSVQIYTP